MEYTSTGVKFSEESLDSSSSYTSKVATSVYTTTDAHDEEYNMNHNDRGLAIIFNQEKFLDEKNLQTRSGTNKDCEELKICLESLRFRVMVCQDYPYRQIVKKIEWAANQDHTNSDCILIAIMSHGSNGGYICAQDVQYKVEQIFQHFTADNCPSLAGKPKVFIIQACRGDQKECGIKMKPKETQKEGESKMIYRIPNHADFILAYSTIPGFSSWRSACNGSWFIQSLCEELKTNGKNYDIMTLLTFVRQRVATSYEACTDDNENNRKKQTSCDVSTLTRLLYFTDKN